MILENVVQSTISSLGYFEDGVYFREPDCFGKLLDGRVIQGSKKGPELYPFI